jgi:hypothetical protein
MDSFGEIQRASKGFTGFKLTPGKAQLCVS